jgi:hypothetical protein
MGRQAERGGQQPSAWERWLRSWWPDSNPLRRPCDRAQTVILTGLLVTFLILAPALALFAARLAYSSALHSQRDQLSTRHQVSAVLLTNAQAASYSGYGTLQLPEVRATWTAPDGQRHSGVIQAPGDAKAGTKVMIWVDAAGWQTAPPLEHAQVTGQEALAAILAPAALGLLLLSVGSVTTHTVNKRRMAAWDKDWRATGPQWSAYR